MTMIDTPPGSHRCPGPSTRDIILSDKDEAPTHLVEESYTYLGDADIPFERYTSSSFFREEVEHMWMKTWQWACREEEIPQTGDYVVYDIVGKSVIVVRTQSGDIKAFANSCLHRGTQLKPSESCGRSNNLRCPFHGFTWSLEGELEDVPCQWDFPHIDEDKFSLPQLKVECWNGFVFINFDSEAAPLRDQLGVLPEHFKNWNLSEKFTSMYIRKKLPANWKACLEAFLESYHVLETHPQGITTVGDANTQYDIYGDHISRFVHLVGYPSPHLESQPEQQAILDALFAEAVVEGAQNEKHGLKIEPGESARKVFSEHLKKNLSETYDRDFSHLSISETIDAIEYCLFPNTCFFPSLLFPMVYRFRPDGCDPDKTIFDLLYLQPLPDSGKIPDPADPFELDEQQSFHDIPGFDPGLATIYDQDTGNLMSQQKGFKASLKPGETLGNYQEIRIRQLHQTLDKYLAGELS